MIPRELKVLHTAIAAQVLQTYIVDMKAENWFTGVFKNFVNNFLEQSEDRKLNPVKHIARIDSAASRMLQIADIVAYSRKFIINRDPKHPK